MKKIGITLSILTVLLYACKDEDVITQNDLASTQATQVHLFAEKIFDNIGKTVEEGFTDNGQNKSCPSYSIINADTSDVDTLIINFGNGDPSCLNYEILRSGKIVITYTGGYRDSLSVITTTFDNYYINYNLVQGERIVTNQGRNNSGNMWFTIDVNNASINTNNNGTIDWESSRVREWVSGQETYFDISDDRYKITGSASGNAANGNAFAVEITESLDVDLGCLFSCVIKSGKTKISPNGYPDRIINYGDSICDCNVDVIINGTTYPIVIGN